jgi:hypothetical protein
MLLKAGRVLDVEESFGNVAPWASVRPDSASAASYSPHAPSSVAVSKNLAGGMLLEAGCWTTLKG